MGKLSIGNQVPFAAGVAGLGVVCLVFQAFALQWQSAPDWLKVIPGAAVVSAVWLIVTGIALLIPRLSLVGAGSATVLFGVWAFVFHGPLVAAQPGQVYVWLGICEIGSLWAASVTLIGAQVKDAVLADRVILTARIIFGLCAVVFGISHFAYADITAKMVPGWLPLPLAWAYITGSGHLAAGLGLISGVQARLAAGMEAAMCAIFVVSLHLPRVISNPTSQMEWTMLCVALAICGAAWVIRSHVKRASAVSADS